MRQPIGFNECGILLGAGIGLDQRIHAEHRHRDAIAAAVVNGIGKTGGVVIADELGRNPASHAQPFRCHPGVLHFGAVLPFIGIAFEILLLVLIDLAETIAEQVGAERHIEKTTVEQAAIVQP